MRHLVSLLFLSISLFGFDYHLKSYTMAEGVECFFGLSTKASEINGGNIVNSCYIQTDEGYIVIDSGPTYSYAQQAYKIMEEKHAIPVKYVINTSADDIHVLGNGFYKEQGAKLIGPTAYREHEQQEKIKLQELISAEAFVNTRFVPLDTYLEKDMRLKVGDTSLEVMKIDSNSDRYLIVHIPDREIIFVGDMIFNNRLPPLKNNRSLVDWLQSIKKIERISWSRLISAHGIKTKYSAIKNTKSYLKVLKDEVEGCLQNDLSAEACSQEVTMSSFMEDNLYQEWHQENVKTAYGQLKKAVDAKPPVAANIVRKETPVKKEEKPKEPVKAAAKPEPKKVTPPPQPKPQPKAEPAIRNYGFSDAVQRAKAQKKIVLIKIRSDNCPYCDELDATMKRNNEIKQLINQNYLMVSINSSRQQLPLGIEVRLTPSLAFVRPDTKKVVMIIPGIEAIGELIDVLKEGVVDGERNGYLK